MRKIMILVAAAIMIVVLSISAVAETSYPYKDAYELFSAWDRHGYPDYITGVWSTNGGREHLTFGIVESCDTDAVKDEILYLVEDVSTVTFTEQKYSYNYLCSIQEELELTWGFSDEIAMLSLGVDVWENCVEVGIDFEAINPATEEFMKDCTERYGDAINIVEGVHAVTLMARPDPTPWIICAACVLMAVVTAVVVVTRSRRITNADGTVTIHKHLSEKQVAALVKDSTAQPSQELDSRILSLK
ncbi:MAG: hypothetical protein IJZ95_06265 [Oscillospiraceae bacterium]|nr:hypothetical protein [Oscillospiraceae bacterium]